MMIAWYCLVSLVVAISGESFKNDSMDEDRCDNTTCFPLPTYSEDPTAPPSLTSLPQSTTSTSTPITTPLQNTTSGPIYKTTTRPKTTFKMEKKSADPTCHCDVASENCDPNCCCDKDCSAWEKSSFLLCVEAPVTPTYGECVSTGIIYRNNTPYPTAVSVTGLLCIARDNFPERNAYLHQEVIRSLDKFERVWKRRVHYYWKPVESKFQRKFEKTQFYKYGDFIWKYYNITDEAVPMGLPASGSSSLCKRLKYVKYLKDSEDACLLPVPRSREDCLGDPSLNARSYCQELIIISSPALVNSTDQIAGSPDKAFISVKQFLCNKEECTEARLLPEPEYNESRSTCANSVLSVELTLRHNGSLGITSASCKLTLGTLDVSESSRAFIRQRFSTSFLSDRENTSVVFRRSGNPGYQDSSPVITKTIDGTEMKTGLTVMSGNGCRTPTPVLFRENMMAHCSFSFPSSRLSNCSALEEEIMSLLLNGTGEIATNGDPGLSADDWLERPPPLFPPPMPGSTCQPPTHLSLAFLFAYTGSLLRPQARLVGFQGQFQLREPVECSLGTCSVRLITVVSFADVSRSAISKYASAPVVKIRLPQDFFYPFTSSSASSFYTHSTFICLSSLYFIFHAIYSFQ